MDITYSIEFYVWNKIFIKQTHCILWLMGFICIDECLTGIWLGVKLFCQHKSLFDYMIDYHLHFAVW